MTSINIKPERQYDCICMGRSCMDLYSNDPGVSFPEIKSFNAYVGGSPTNIVVGASKLGLKTATHIPSLNVWRLIDYFRL